MAWVLLPDGVGTSRLFHPEMGGHYDEPQEVETKEVDGTPRRVVHLREAAAERLVDEDVGERVLAEDYFDASDDADAEADTPPDEDEDEGGEESDDDSDEPPDEPDGATSTDAETSDIDTQDGGEAADDAQATDESDG